jgi:hypothetical protein
MPEPMMPPMTIMVASKKLRRERRGASVMRGRAAKVAEMRGWGKSEVASGKRGPGHVVGVQSSADCALREAVCREVECGNSGSALPQSDQRRLCD